MEKGIDTAGLMKSLEEGKSKLVFSNTSSISDYDVEGYENDSMIIYSYIRQYHENAVASTLEESQNLFDTKCSSRIWKMMHKEFLDSRSSILESEKRQSNLHAPSQTASFNFTMHIISRQSSTLNKEISDSSHHFE